MSVAYTDPEVAWVGLTENEAKDKGIDYEKAQFPWAASGRALSLGRSEGFTKLLFDPKTGRVLGGAIVGPAAGDLIAEIGLAIEMGADAADISAVRDRGVLGRSLRRYPDRPVYPEEEALAHSRVIRGGVQYEADSEQCGYAKPVGRF